MVKKNYFMSKVDKYIYKYDVNKLRCYTKAERETKVKNRKGREWNGYERRIWANSL